MVIIPDLRSGIWYTGCMSPQPFTFRAKVWLYDGPTAWHFITVPKRLSKQLQELYADIKRGWGSLPVSVTIGETTWKTSIFPDKEAGAYLLPLKKEVRKKEQVRERMTVEVSLTVRD